MIPSTEISTVVTSLSSLIGHSLSLMEMERSAPHLSADASDDYIKFHNARAFKLRVLRTSFEDLMAEEPARGV